MSAHTRRRTDISTQERDFLIPGRPRELLPTPPEVFASTWTRTQGDIIACIRAALEADAVLNRRPPSIVAPVDDEWLEAQARRIAGAVALAHGLTTGDLRSRSRSTRISRVRADAMLLIRELLELSFPAIGALFFRDHSTVMHACDVARARRLARPDKAAKLRARAEAAMASTDEMAMVAA